MRRGFLSEPTISIELISQADKGRQLNCHALNRMLLTFTHLRSQKVKCFVCLMSGVFRSDARIS